MGVCSSTNFKPGTVDDEGGIHSAAMTIFLVMRPTNIGANDEFLWPDSPCEPPTLVRHVGEVTETFPYEAETLNGLHCLPCVFQIGPAFLGKSETGQPNWTPQPEEGIAPGPLPADEVVPCERNPHGPVKFPPCNAYLQTIVPPWNATQPTPCGFVHALVPFVLAVPFPIGLRVLLTDHWAGIGVVTLHWQGYTALVIFTFEFRSPRV